MVGRLALDPQEVTLARVWRLLQGDDPVLGLHGPDPACAVGRSVQASLHALDREISDALTRELERTTIHDVLTHSAPRLPT